MVIQNMRQLTMQKIDQVGQSMSGPKPGILSAAP
jgi:hypothetical protein